MKTTALLTAFLSLSLSAHAADMHGLRAVPLGAPKASHNMSGPVQDGLALSLTNTPLKRESPGHIWMALEIRNVSSQDKFLKGVGLLSTFQLFVTDAHGTRIPAFSPGPKMEYDPPMSSTGTGIAPGYALFLPVPLDAFVPLAPGTYTVTAKAYRLIDAQKNAVVPLVSNPLTIRVP